MNGFFNRGNFQFKKMKSAAACFLVLVMLLAMLPVTDMLI
jgi:hypothetical protein